MTEKDHTPDGGAANEAEGAKPVRRSRGGNRRASSPAPSNTVPVKAKEDDPRVWGDEPEDRESWLREQRPPHWG